MFSGPNPFSTLLGPGLQLELDQPLSDIQQNKQSEPKTSKKASEKAAPSTRHYTVLDLLETSYRNLPQLWDQEIVEPISQVSIKEEEATLYPTVPMYNRRHNFEMFDIDTLFFVYYSQPGTYQSQLAEHELKKLNWLLNQQSRIWYKMSYPGSTPNANGKAQPPAQVYKYFDYRGTWTTKTVSAQDFTKLLAQHSNS